MIAIVDYGVGNLENVYKALKSIGVEAVMTSDPVEIYEADKIILPGVGAFKEAIYTINHSGLRTVLDESVAFGKPFLGICLGMQLLFERSYENGVHEGLGYIPGEVVKLEISLKVPHIGWNTLEIIKEAPLFTGIKQESYVYFAHAYHMKSSEQYMSAYTTYGERFGIGVQKGNLYGVQFHPEKSSEVAKKWERLGAGYLHLVDLDGAKEGYSVNERAIKRIVEAVSIPIELGGGIRTLEQIEAKLDLGVSRVILGSSAVKHKKLLQEALARFGSERIVVGVDAKDGMMQGPNIEETKVLIEANRLEVIASGAIIGKALYLGTIDLKEVVSLFEGGTNKILKKVGGAAEVLMADQEVKWEHIQAELDKRK